MLKNIIKIARAAGKDILTYYANEVAVFEKDDDSPLTKADLAAHHLILERLHALDADIPVISEESGIPPYEERKNWNQFWIVDPLDGTKEFIKKNGEFTVNIARIENGEPVLGVIYVPAHDQLYYGAKGTGSFRISAGEAPVRVFSRAADRSTRLNVAVSRSHASSTLKDDLAKEGIKVEKLITAGSSLKFCLLAEGAADLYYRTGPTMEWDVAAGDCIYRNSAKNGQHRSPLTYNKPTLRNKGFMMGL